MHESDATQHFGKSSLQYRQTLRHECQRSQTKAVRVPAGQPAESRSQFKAGRFSDGKREREALTGSALPQRGKNQEECEEFLQDYSLDTCGARGRE